ncbi:hypothetical protein [Picornaviridae sp.]|nr:hypothetical protein [Picornaviridae sp.]
MSATNSVNVLTRRTNKYDDIKSMSEYGKNLKSFRDYWGCEIPLRFCNMDDSLITVGICESNWPKLIRFLMSYDKGVKNAKQFSALTQEISGLYYWHIAFIVNEGPFVGCLGYGTAAKKKDAIIRAMASLEEVMLETFMLIQEYHPSRLLINRLRYGLISEDYFIARDFVEYLDEDCEFRISGYIDSELDDEELSSGHYHQKQRYRETKFSKQCIACYKFDPNEYLSFDRLIHDIETNPGPVTLPMTDIKLTKLELQKTDFEFPDGTKFVMQDEHFIIENDSLIVKKPTSEFVQYINSYSKTGKTTDFKCDVTWKKTSTIWSNHHDYKPFLRCIITGHDKLNKVNKTDDIFKFYTQTKGSAFRAKNFLFIPTSLLKVRFSRNWYDGDRLELKTLNMFMSSIVNQDMNKTQFVQTIVRIVQLKMMLLKSEEKVLDYYSDLFWTIYRATVENLKHKRTSYTDYELSLELAKIDIIVPTTSSYMSPKKLNTKNILYLENDVLMQEQILNQKLLAPYDQMPAEEMGLDQLRDFYLSGRSLIFGTTVTRSGFNASKIYKRLAVNQVPITTDSQKFLYKLISCKQRDYNIQDIFEKVVKSMNIDDLSPEFQRKILLKMCKIQFGSMDYKGLYQLNMKENKTDEDYTTLAISSQNEMVAFGKLFDIDYDFNLFANEEYVRMLKGPSNITKEVEEEEEEGWLTRLKNKIFAPAYKVADKWEIVGDNISDLAELATKTLEDFNGRLSDIGFLRTEVSGMVFDSSNLRTAYQSAKNVIVALFEDILTKICSAFGVKYERRIHPQTLFMYYLIWKETRNKYMKFMLIVDIAIQLGIADAMWNIMTKVYEKCKHHLVPRNITKTLEKEKYLMEQNVTIKMMQEASKEKRKKAIEVKTKANDNVKDEVGFIDGIIQLLSEATPAVLGTVAITMLGVLGFKATDEKEISVGKRIVNIARNMSFVALGLGSIPKVFTQFMGVFKYVKEWIMEKLCKNFKSEVTLEEEAKKFLRTAIYTPGASEYVMFSDLAVCIKFFQHYSQAVEFSKELYRIRCPRIAAALKDRIKDITAMNTLVMSAVAMQLKNVELFHIQYYSEPGVGKTDLMFYTVDYVDKIRIEIENQIRKDSGLPEVKQSKIPSSGIYMANENTNNEDAYHGQKKCIVDDTHVVKNPTPESIVDKLSQISGTPRIVKKADLNSKGMIRSVSVQVSATNVPFPRFDGVYVNEAIWRRRVLVGLRIKDEYKLENGLPDNSKIIKDNLDRKRGEHLLFTFLDPLNDKKVPELSWMKDLESSDYWQVLDSKVRVHFSREETRQCQNPTMAELRMHFDAMMDNIRSQIGQDAPQDVGETIAMMRNQIEKKVDAWIAEDAEDAKLYEHTRKQELDQLEILNIVSPYMIKENDELIPRLVDLECNAEETPHNITNIFSSAYAELEYERKPDCHIYRMVASDRLNRTRDARIDYNNVFVDSNTDSQSKHLAYRSEKPLNKLDQEVVLHHLMRLSVLDCEVKIRAAIEMGLEKQKTMTLYESIKQKIGTTIRRTEEVLRSSGTWLWDQVSELAKEFYYSAIHGIGITSAFFVFVAIIEALVPSNISYTRQNDRRIVTGPTISNISRTLEENTQSLAKAVSYKMFFKHEQTNECMGIGIGGSVFLVNWHSVSHITRPCTVIIADNMTVDKDPAQCIKTLNINPNQIHRIKHKGKDYDAALIHIEGFRPVRTALNYFVTDYDLQEDFINFTEAKFQTLTLRDKEDSMKKNTYNVKREWLMSPWHTATKKTPGSTVVSHSDHFVFDETIYSAYGDSGSIVYHDNTRIAPKFFGILTAASSVATYFGCVTQEAIRATLVKFSNMATMTTSALQGDKIENIHKLYDVFEYPEHVVESHLPDQSVSTNPGYERTAIARHFLCANEPAVQKENDPRVPEGAVHFLKISLNKSIDYEPGSFTLEEEKFYCDFLRTMYLQFLPQLRSVRVYDTVRAITGVQRMGSTAIDTKSSAGLPYKLEKGVVGKRPLIQYNITENCWQIQERVFRDVEMYERQYLAGHAPHNYKLEFRKRELVSREKITRSKTRTVGTGNMIHLIVYNKLFKDFFTILKNSWNQGRAIPIITGLNMEEHTETFMSYFADKNYILDFDVKAWEKKVTLKHLLLNNRVRTQIIKDMYALRGEKLPYDIETVGAGLAIDYMDAIVAFEKVLYKKYGGLMSGHPGTLVENSEAHLGELALIMRSILIKAGRPDLATPRKILENITPMVAADDLIMSATPSWQQYAELPKLIGGYKERGIEVTAADKSQNFKVNDIYTAQFLKHNIRIDEDGRHVHAPQAEIIYQLLHWVRTDTELTKQQQFTTNIDNAMRMAYFRGREFYDELKDKLNFALLDTKERLQWPYTYEYMRDKITYKFRDTSDPIANAQHEDTEIDFRF